MKKPVKGIFISIEGIDGSGKTSALNTLKARLSYHGFFVHTTREPGGSPLGEKIRELILNEKMSARTELLLFNAGRSDHIEVTIQQHLEQRHVVISDRFMDSSYAYQGFGRGMEEEALILEEMVVNNDYPDYTLYFKISIGESVKRVNKRGNVTGDINRLDKETLDFKERVLEGYTKREHRYVIFDAEKDIVDVHSDIINWVDNVFAPAHPLIEEETEQKE